LLELPKVNVITADPNWIYANWTSTANGAAVSHYTLSGYDFLAALAPTIKALADDDCILGLWGTWPKADEHHALYKDWGFDYITGFPWVKVVPNSGEIRRGIGFWQQSASEFFSICRIGKPKKQKIKDQVIGMLVGEERQFYDRIKKHSQKPYGIHEWLEELFPDVPKAELFATEHRDGWHCYGHKLGTHIDFDGIMTIEEAKAGGRLPEDYDPWTWNSAKAAKST